MQNGSLITEPHPIIVRFYYYYSYLTLLISWILAPFLFYTILTQSKALGKFKWLIFNYSIWSLCLTTLLSLTKPLMFMPAAAGIQLGIFRNLFDYKSTLIAIILYIIFCVNCLAGLAATLTYRYLMVFPSILKNWFSLKKAFLFCLFFPTIAYTLLLIVFSQYINFDIDIFPKWAKNYDIFLERYLMEKTFFVTPYEIVRYGCEIPFFLCVFAYFIFTFVFIFLFYQIRKHNSKRLSKNKNFLIISSLTHIFITAVFILTPYTVFLGLIYFQIPQSSTFFVFMLCFFVTHCFLDYISTLYFITPYRKFICKLLFKENVSRVKVVTHLSQYSGVNNASRVGKRPRFSL